MKKRIIQSTILILTIALILSVIPSTGDAQRPVGAKIIWLEDIKIEPANNLTSLRLNNTPITKGEFGDLSNRILRKVLKRENVKLSEERIGEDKNFIAWIDEQDPSSLIWQDLNNGNLFFSNQKTKFLRVEKANLPRGEKAMSIATGFLKELNLLPADFENAELLHTGGMFSQDLQDGKTGPRVQHLISLQWGRVINGVPVQGPGSKIVMELGNGGEVVSLTKKWNPTMAKLGIMNPELTIREPIRGELKLKEGARDIGERKINPDTGAKMQLSEYFTPEEIRDLATKALGAEWTTADSIEIRNVRLVYYDRSGDYIQPAYAIEAFVMAGKNQFQYLHHIAALRNPPEPIYPILHTEMPNVMDIQQIPGTIEEKND